MSDLLPQLIVLALGGHDRATLAPPHHLVLGFAKVWDSRRPLPNATTLGLGYFVVLRGDGYLKANPLFAEEAAGLRAPEDERR